MEKRQLEKLSDRAIGIAIAALILFFSLPVGRLAKTRDWSQYAPHLIIFFFSLIMMILFWTAQITVIGLIMKPGLTRKIVWVSQSYFFFLILLAFASGWIADNP